MTLNTTEKNALRLLMEGDAESVSKATLRRLKERGLVSGRSTLTFEGMALAAPEVGAVMKTAKELEVGDRLFIPPTMNIDGIVPTVTVAAVEHKPKTTWLRLRIMAKGEWIMNDSRPKHEDGYAVLVDTESAKVETALERRRRQYVENSEVPALAEFFTDLIR